MTSVTSSSAGRGGATTSIELRFRAADGRSYVCHVSMRATQRYQVGGTVAVAYQACLPSSATIAGSSESSAAVPWPVAALGAVVVLLITGHNVARIRRIRRILTTNPWVIASSELIELPLGLGRRRGSLRMLELRGAPDGAVVLVPPVSWRAHALNDLVPHAWVAGAGRRFLAAPVGGAAPLELERVRLLASALDERATSRLPSRLDHRPAQDG